MRGGTHTSPPTKRVHFGAGSLQKVEEEARPARRAFVITGRTLYEKTDLIPRVEALLGEKHAGTYSGMGQHTPGSSTLAPSLEVAKNRVPEDRWPRLEEALDGDPPRRVCALVRELDLPRRLRDVGVPEDDLEDIARELGDHEEDALAILRDAY